MALTPTQEAQVLQLVAEQAALLSLADNEATIISKLGATKVNLSSLGSAVTFDDADVMLIRQGTTDLSIAGSVVKAAVAVPDASETVKGKVELATSAETITGTDNTRAVHPAGLASLTATQTRAGLIEIATDVEALAGTDTLRAATPAGIRAAVSATGTAPIYAARAWVTWRAGTGVPIIQASGNVSSLSDLGIGKLRVNFTANMSNINYSISGSATAQLGGTGIAISAASNISIPTDKTVSGVEIVTGTTTATVDVGEGNLVFFGA